MFYFFCLKKMKKSNCLFAIFLPIAEGPTLLTAPAIKYFAIDGCLADPKKLMGADSFVQALAGHIFLIETVPHRTQAGQMYKWLNFMRKLLRSDSDPIPQAIADACDRRPHPPFGSEGQPGLPDLGALPLSRSGWGSESRRLKVVPLRQRHVELMSESCVPHMLCIAQAEEDNFLEHLMHLAIGATASDLCKVYHVATISFINNMSLMVKCNQDVFAIVPAELR